MPVLLRPDGCLQIGWDPRRAVLVRPPAGLSATTLATVLRALPLQAPAVHRLAARLGLHDTAGFDAVLDGLRAAGVLGAGVRTSSQRTPRTLSVRVHGCGPLSDLLISGLRCSGARVGHTSHANAVGAPVGVDLVVLADWLAVDPRLLRDLHTARVPHLPVRVRDGAGLVGPLVIPGVTSCLICADLHRTDRDPAWPALAAQLREVIGTADRPTLLATAALALGQVQRVIAGVRAGAAPDAVTGVPDAPPPEFDVSWEIDVGSGAIRARRWPRHPLCGCWPGGG
ncbi:MAG: cyclodehydratase [Mycobacterium sp.]|nr:cyclodehydratase [Mycobacterium sp.]